jgi:uncharacterized protein (UPF0276 family)
MAWIVLARLIAEVVNRTGCGLLLDVNNVHVASTNQHWDPFAYIDGYPLNHVCEIHLAGHAQDFDERDRPLLIDSHDRPVEDVVWELYTHAAERIGPRPTLIEWGADVPDWRTLYAQAERAEAILFDVGARLGMAAAR